jgi:nucleotide-binding universal stress UspA family protein
LFLSASLFLSALLPFTSIPAHAEENRIVDSLPALVDQVTTPLPEENVGAAISPMRKGNKAMFTGVLLSPLAIATLITELKSAELVTEIEVKRAKDEAAAWCIKDLEKAAGEDLALILHELKSGGLKAECAVEIGSPSDVILDTIGRLNANLVIMGSHGKKGLSRLIMGSVAETVVRKANCPVLIVKSEENEFIGDD